MLIATTASKTRRRASLCRKRSCRARQYEFRLGDAVPEDHLVRKIDAALDLSWLRGAT
jgi:hypothetical protein